MVIDGWRPFTCPADGRFDTKRPEWIAVQLTEKVAPWAFYRGAPYNAIEK